MHSAPARFETSFLGQRVCGQAPTVSLLQQRAGVHSPRHPHASQSRSHKMTAIMRGSSRSAKLRLAMRANHTSEPSPPQAQHLRCVARAASSRRASPLSAFAIPLTPLPADPPMCPSQAACLWSGVRCFV